MHAPKQTVPTVPRILFVMIALFTYSASVAAMRRVSIRTSLPSAVSASHTEFARSQQKAAAFAVKLLHDLLALRVDPRHREARHADPQRPFAERHRAAACRRAQFDRLRDFVRLRVDPVDLAVLAAQHPDRAFARPRAPSAPPPLQSTCPPGWSAGPPAGPCSPPGTSATARSRRKSGCCSRGRRGIPRPLRSAPDRCARACRARP